MDLFSGSNLLTRIRQFTLPNFSYYKYYSSLSLFIIPCKYINLIANAILHKPLSNFNLAILGLAFIAIFTYALYLIFDFFFKRKWYLVYIIFIPILIIFCDEGYTLYFHSFFAENVQYVFTILSIGLYLKLIETKCKKRYLVFYYISVIIMATSKYGYIPVGVLFALLPLVFLSQFKIKYIIPIITALIIAYLGYFYTLTPDYIERDTLYNSVFTGILNFQDNPEQVLTEMGIPSKYAF